MRKFVAACCCVIVGLEVLVAVPTVVCIVMFAYLEAGTTVAAPSQPVDFSSLVSNPAIVPPPNYASYETSPAPVRMASPPAPAAPTICPPPPSPSPEVTAIAEVRQQNGSPLDGTVVAPSNAAPSIEPFVAAVEQIASNETACLMPPPAAPTQPVAAANPVESPTAPAAPQPGNLVEALRVCSEQLYVKANDLEASGNYGRADDVRHLARRIREEIQTLVAEAPVLPPVPSTVTAAVFDPQTAEPAPVGPDPAAPGPTNSIPLADPTVPSALPQELPQAISEVPELPVIPAP